MSDETIEPWQFRNGFPEQLRAAGFEMTGNFNIMMGVSGAIEVRSIDFPSETAWLEMFACQFTARQLGDQLRCPYCVHTISVVVPNPWGNCVKMCRGCAQCFADVQRSVDAGRILSTERVDK